MKKHTIGMIVGAALTALVLLAVWQWAGPSGHGWL